MANIEKAINAVDSTKIDLLNWQTLSEYVSFEYAMDHPEIPWNLTLLLQSARDLRKLRPEYLIQFIDEDIRKICENPHISIFDIWVLLDQITYNHDYMYDERILWKNMHKKSLTMEFILLNYVNMPYYSITGCNPIYFSSINDIDNLLDRPEWDGWSLNPNAQKHLVKNRNIEERHIDMLEKNIWIDSPPVIHCHKLSYQTILRINKEWKVPFYDFYGVHENPDLTPEQMMEIDPLSLKSDKIRILHIISPDRVCDGNFWSNPNLTYEFLILFESMPLGLSILLYMLNFQDPDLMHHYCHLYLYHPYYTPEEQYLMIYDHVASIFFVLVLTG